MNIALYAGAAVIMAVAGSERRPPHQNLRLPHRTIDSRFTSLGGLRFPWTDLVETLL